MAGYRQAWSAIHHHGEAGSGFVVNGNFQFGGYRLGPARIREYGVCVVRYRLLISGRVQGVFFRDTCRRMAERHGVNGWVRNLPDGSVEAVFEGPDENVGRLMEWSRHGPRSAAVRDIRVQAEPPEGISGFQVR
jgi:acylphosphatase